MAQKNWHTPSASNFCQNVYRTSALVEFESDLTMLQELWRSELLQVGTVCVHRNDLLESTACWFLHSSAAGALVVYVKIVPVGSKCFAHWLVVGDENLRIVHVTAVGDWFGLLTLAASPRDSFEAVGSHTCDVCVSLECHTNTRYPILEFCARTAFRGLTKTCMSRIMVSKGYTWVGRKLTLELEILAFLIRELIADISDEECSGCWNFGMKRRHTSCRA